MKVVKEKSVLCDFMLTLRVPCKAGQFYDVAGDVFQAAFLGIVVLLEHVWCDIKCTCDVFRRKARVQPNPSQKNSSQSTPESLHSS